MNVVSWPRHPPGCTCGCQEQRPDCGPAWSQDAIDCYNQIAMFRRMVQQVIAEMGLQPGVTNGSDAAPGQVGEFITFDQAVPFPGYPTLTDTTIPLAVIPPGDWDLWYTAVSNTEVGTTHPVYVGGYSSWIFPAPSGLSNIMTVGLTIGTGLQGQTAQDIVVENSSVARANFSKPTLLPMRVVVNQTVDPALIGGVIEIHLEGRRMR